METLYSLIRMKEYLLVKCHHTATYWHVHRYLSWHAANNEHFFPCVRMECWFIHLFSSPHLFICCSYWFISMSVGEKTNNHTATVEYTSSKCNSSPQTLTSLLLPGVVTRTFEKHSVPCLQTECNINRIMHLTGGVDWCIDISVSSWSTHRSLYWSGVGCWLRVGQYIIGRVVFYRRSSIGQVSLNR